jgi:hypothetical protein
VLVVLQEPKVHKVVKVQMGHKVLAVRQEPKVHKVV